MYMLLFLDQIIYTSTIFTGVHANVWVLNMSFLANGREFKGSLPDNSVSVT